MPDDWHVFDQQMICKDI